MASVSGGGSPEKARANMPQNVEVQTQSASAITNVAKGIMAQALAQHEATRDVPVSKEPKGAEEAKVAKLTPQHCNHTRTLAGRDIRPMRGQ
ncbi:MAG: hypothetical protein S4CHLAM102_10900 [Chlamydiia bacterium]|nr:hypothetical protein [Chlamydiia bacterium]